MSTTLDNRIPNRIREKISDIHAEIVRAKGDGMITRSQAQKMDAAIDAFAHACNDAVKMFDRIAGRAPKPVLYNSGRNMEADRHEDDGMD